MRLDYRGKIRAITLWRLLLFLFTGPLSYSVLAVELKFFYEEQELQPFFMGEGEFAPKENPGIFIEMLQIVDSRFDDLEITFHRLPWKRCIDNLKQGEADAIVASHKFSRENFAAYPMENEMIDMDFAISTAQYCLFTKRNSKFRWDGESFSYTPNTPISVPQGYSIVSMLESHNLPLVFTNSSEGALDLLAIEKTVAAITYCEVGANYLWKNKANDLQIMAQSPSLSTRRGFLVFSKQFYEQNTDLAHRIWKEIAVIRDKDFPGMLEKYEALKSREQ